MIYQFKNDEIKKCIQCPMWVFPEMATMPLCNQTGETIPKGSTPEENDCPLVAISKTETTSCEWCEGGINTASLMGEDMMMRFVRPVNYCPNCGRKLN